MGGVWFYFSSTDRWHMNCIQGFTLPAFPIAWHDREFLDAQWLWKHLMDQWLLGQMNAWEMQVNTAPVQDNRFLPYAFFDLTNQALTDGLDPAFPQSGEANYGGNPHQTDVDRHTRCALRVHDRCRWKGNGFHLAKAAPGQCRYHRLLVVHPQC